MKIFANLYKSMKIHEFHEFGLYAHPTLQSVPPAHFLQSWYALRSLSNVAFQIVSAFTGALYSLLWLYQWIDHSGIISSRTQAVTGQSLDQRPRASQWAVFVCV